jgi:HEPN domain-containing protein
MRRDRTWACSVGGQRWTTRNWASRARQKAVLALLGPVGRTHNPAVQLRQALADGLFGGADRHRALRLAERSEAMGPDVHIQTDYGDEAGGRTPWELFSECDARKALALAEEAVTLAMAVIQNRR